MDLISTVDSLLSYDSETGIFTWKQNRRTVKAGQVAGHKSQLGYVDISVCGKLYQAHRLAWMLVHREIPNGEIDHINGIRHDNRIANLRIVDSRGNKQNKRLPMRTNKSGFLGVDFCQGKYRAQIRVNGEKLYLGLFDSPEDAHAAYLKAKREHHETCTI